MREDMKKVLTDRPRRGSAASYHEVRSRESRGDLEDLPTHQGMRAPHVRNWGGKEFSDHVQPLIRYLWGCIGRPWNDVWSEICERVPSNNTVDSHLKDHVLREIEIHTYVEDGEVYVKATRRWFQHSKPRGLYVDPRDGLVKAGANDESNSRRKAHRHPVNVDGVWYTKDASGVLTPTKWGNEKNALKLLDDRKAFKMDGIWYVFELGWVPPIKTVPYIDEETGETKTRKVYERRFDEYYRMTVHSEIYWRRYHMNKRQMNSRDLKNYDLRNDPVKL